jgi:hypothetical protein
MRQGKDFEGEPDLHGEWNAKAQGWSENRILFLLLIT